MKNEKLRKDNSSLHKANTELLSLTKDSGNKQVSTKTKMLTVTIHTHFDRDIIKDGRENSAMGRPRNKWGSTLQQPRPLRVEWPSWNHAVQRNLAVGKQYNSILYRTLLRQWLLSKQSIPLPENCCNYLWWRLSKNNFLWRNGESFIQIRLWKQEL